MRIIDTHLHLIYPDRLTYPWLSGAPAINKPWSAETYWAEAKPLGVEQALHMEVDVTESDIEKETGFVLGLSGIVGAIAACRPEHADFPAQLDRLLAIGGTRIKGLRRILHEIDDSVSQPQLFADNLRLLAEHNLTFDLCLRADQLHLGVALAQKLPEVTFILDHCGNPDINGIGLDPWRRDLKSIAALSNVHGKVSGIVNHCDPDWTTETLRPYVEHVIESFGWDRVVFGSDYPVVTKTGTLTRWVEALSEIVSDETAANQQRLFAINAERIYRLT
ncbi:amidohydrolase [Devosia sp. BK]|uniref:amidohydrolase family protein n=1 Tax=Devosia sp. BK TaxID=2871706 RepID=UPI002939F779|nr:amidohydrolase [Devosia sp. BK]MDV3253442.1 amidohydrolase [Devosia sp. BK]